MSDPVPSRPPEDRRDRGVTAYAAIFAVPEEQVPAAFAARVGPVFAEEALQAAGGPAWSSPALSSRERSIAIITALAAQGVSGDRLHTHLRLARQHGLDDDALTTLMTLLAGYLGYPRASLAMEAAHSVSGVALQSGTVGADPGTAEITDGPMDMRPVPSQPLDPRPGSPRRGAGHRAEA